MHKLLRWTVAGGLTCTLMGCSSLHLYDSAADAAATSAKTDYDASKITDSIKLSRAMFDALDAREIEAFRSVNLAERNGALLSLLSESGTAKQRMVGNGFVARFNKRVDERLALLTGNAENPSTLNYDLTAATAKVNLATNTEKRAREQLNDFSTAFAALPACNAQMAALKDSTDLTKATELLKMPDLKPKNAVVQPAWVSHIKAVGDACSKLIEARKALDQRKNELGGQLNFAMRNTTEQGRLLKKSQDDSKAAAAQLKTATKAFADAQKAAKDGKAVDDLTCDLSKPVPASSPGATDASAKKNELCKVLADLKELEDFGIVALSEERLAQINEILTAVSGEKPPTTAAKTPLEPGLVLISTTSRFAQAWTQYQKTQDKKLPALEPLLIDKEMTASQLAYAQSGVQLAESRVQYAQAYEDATRLEVRLLMNAKAEIAALGTPPAPNTTCGKELTAFCASVSDLLNDKKLAKASGNGGETANRRVYRALTYLSESFSVARDRQLEAELRLIDTEYRVALSRSEASLASWNVLLSVPVDQLKTYHAGGIKPAEAASLTAQMVQALAAVGIAVRIK